MDNAAARKRFAELRGQAGIAPAELDEVWAALETVEAAALVGQWTGDEFDTGHPMNGQLGKARWYGKIMRSVDDVDPIVCRGEDGELFNNTALSKGGASLWNVEFRGEVTATMVYDGHAVLDHFKRVDADTLMGVMNGKQQRQDPSLFYFLLERADVAPRA